MSCFFSTVHVIRFGPLKASLLAALPLLLLAPGGPAFAQTLLPPLPYTLPQGEAPPTLFSAQIGDSEVDFLLEGSWRTELAAALGLVITPTGLVYMDEFPSFGALWPPVFRNFPRLTFSIWLRQRYFLESSVIWDFVENPSYDYSWWDKNYWLAGYRGKEGEFLRSVLIGNRQVGVDQYPFLEVPDTGSSSLGISARMGAGRSSHQLMLRYDNNEPAEATFLGRNRVEETPQALDQYLRGRFFRLPDAGVQDLEVYLEDKDGAYTGTDLDATGGSRHYRLATVDDATLDAVGGTVTLKKASTGAVLVYYENGVGSPVGTVGMGIGALPHESGGRIDLSLFPYNPFDFTVPFLGQAMADRRVSVNSRTALRLWKPGEFSPFEILAAYPVPSLVPAEASRIRVQVLKKGNPDAVNSTDVKFRLAPGDDYLTAFRDENLRGNLRNLYPFLDEDILPTPNPQFDPQNLLYGPNGDPSPGYLQHELRVSQLTPVSSFGLGADVVPGSVQVLRNGVTETRFQFDAASGTVSFLTEIDPDDRLVISFRRKQSLAGNGDLLFIWGNTIPLGGVGTLQVASGLRWNVVPGSFTEEAYARTGSALVSAGLKGEAGPLRYDVSAAVGITNPDTTGRMRLLGMEGQGREITLSESTAWPAAPPANPDVVAVPPGALSRMARGKLYYRDLPYADGSKPGPYVASERLVLDFDLTAGQWVGTQIPLAPGQGLADLSRLKSVSLSYRAPELTGSVTAYLQIGDISEDLDADGILDEEASASSAGFLFNDPSNGVVLRVGTNAENLSNGRRDSEDVDGNGTLDREDASTAPATPNLVVPLTESLSGPLPIGSTPRFHTFTAAELARLRRARSLRLLLVESGGAAASGRFEVERINLEGSSFFGTGTSSVREIEEWASNALPPAQLIDAFPEVKKTFHPYGETQKVLEAAWPDASAWKITGFTHAPSEGIDYRRIVYYYRLPTAPGGALDFSLLDDQGEGIHWSIPAAAPQNAWSRIEVSLDDRAVYLDEAAVAGATVTEDAGRGSLSFFTVSQSGTPGAGLLYLDEVQLTDPKSSLGAAAKGRLELQLPGALVSIGGHPLLHDLSLRQEASGATKGFTPLYGDPQSESSFSSRTELSVGISVVDLDANLQVAASGTEASLAGGHRLAFPIPGLPVTFLDAFSLREGAAGLDLARRNRLGMSVAGVGALQVEAGALSQEGLLTQTWGANLALNPWILDLRQSLTLTETRDGYEVPDRDYFSSWIGSYALLAPWEGGVEQERLGSAQAAWSVSGRTLGARLAAGYDTHSSEILASGRTQTSTLRLEASLPLAFRRQDAVLFALTPGYRRQLQLIEHLDSPGDLGLDLSDGLAELAAQSYWFQAVPGDELFSASVADQFTQLSLPATTAVYTPEVFLTMSRFTSSRLYDLFVPATLELSLNRELRREGVLVGSRNNYRLTLQSRALNLFGSLGAYPLFPFYRTDEASGSVQLTATEAKGATERLSLLAGQSLACDGEKSRLTLENNFTYTYDVESRVWSDNIGGLLTWERHPAGGVRVPLLPAATGAKGYWSHEESLSAGASGGEAGEGFSIHPFNLVLAHTSSVVLPDFGYIKGGLSLGLDAEDVAGEGIYWRIGLKLSLEAQIQF